MTLLYLYLGRTFPCWSHELQLNRPECSGVISCGSVCLEFWQDTFIGICNCAGCIGYNLTQLRRVLHLGPTFEMFDKLLQPLENSATRCWRGEGVKGWI